MDYSLDDIDDPVARAWAATYGKGSQHAIKIALEHQRQKRRHDEWFNDEVDTSSAGSPFGLDKKNAG